MNWAGAEQYPSYATMGRALGRPGVFRAGFSGTLLGLRQSAARPRLRLAQAAELDRALGEQYQGAEENGWPQASGGAKRL